jgi:hypothetical protein
MHKFECDGAERQTKDHDWYGKEEDTPASDAVNVMECCKGEEEIRRRYDEGCCCGVAEAHHGEDGGAKVHEGVLHQSCQCEAHMENL